MSQVLKILLETLPKSACVKGVMNAEEVKMDYDNMG